MLKKLSLCLLIGWATPTIAFQQTIYATVEVKMNDHQNTFQVMFRSSDFFDSFRSTRAITEGSDIVTHLYEMGPKNIKLRVGLANNNQDAVVLPGENCDFLTRQNQHWFETDYMKISPYFMEWIFQVDEIYGSNIYHLNCILYSIP